MTKSKHQTKQPVGQESAIGRQIVGFLKENKGRPFSRKELSAALGITKKNYNAFREALNQLVRSGKVMRVKGGRYTVAAALKTIRGSLQMTRKGFGFVTDERTEEEIFISANNLNTALNNDLVEVQLFAVSRGRNKEGKITRVLARSQTSFVGTYHRSEYYGFVVPDDPKVYRDFYIPEAKAGGAQHGQKVVVELEKWDSSQLNPEGRIVEILGYPDEPGVDVASVAKSYGLPLSFPKAVEKEAARVSLKVTPEEVNRRLDLRDWVVFTIDPEDAKDFDDAVSLQKLDNGNWQLGVHIADVSYFVPEGSLLDKEALQRGTSVYLVDRVIPMLPEHISNEVCSLKPHEDRFTFSCIMEITPKGDLVDYTIRESIIHSKRRYSYEEAQAIIDDPASEDAFAPILRQMRDLSRLLRQRRMDMGSIDFDTSEVKFRLDDRGKPVEIIPRLRLETHEMIEEFMLMANQTVTRHIQRLAEKRRMRTYPFIYRVHEKPSKDKLENFRNFLRALGYKVNVRKNISPADFQAILQQLEGTPDEILIKEVALRTMMKAVYSQNNIGHFGLAFEYYTHFTSPIRRYPDLVVHRLLKEYQHPVRAKRLRALKKELKRICERSSERERIAVDAERESVRIKQVEWIADHVGEEFTGLISGVTSFGIFVEITPELIEGLVRMEDLTDDFYILDEKTYTITGRESGRSYRLGDQVRIRVARVDLEKKQVDFLLLGKVKTPSE